MNTIETKRSKGFTLIELLIVIAIIGLFATLAAVVLNKTRQKSRDTKRMADIKQIQTALALFFADKNYYPPPIPDADGILLGPNNDGDTAFCLDEDGFVPTCDAGGITYLNPVPGDPAINSISNRTFVYATYDSSLSACAIEKDCTYYEIVFYTEGSGVGELDCSGKCTACPQGIVEGSPNLECID